MGNPRGPYKKNHPETCSVDGCGRPFYGKGWCAMHYMRWRRTGDPMLSRIDRQHDGTCSVAGCDQPYEGKGLCRNHYRQAKYAEAPEVVLNTTHAYRASASFAIAARDMRRLLASPCMACGTTEQVEFEHLVPIARGGTHSIGNLARLCHPCNSSKRNQTWTEWRASDKPRARKLREEVTLLPSVA